MSLRERLPRSVGGYEVDGESPVGAATTLLAVALALVLVVPLGWLFVDVLGLGGRAVDLLVAPESLTVLVRSVSLVGVVTTASVLLGVPLALLTVQSDLPFERFWTVTAALPLAIPSYLGAFAAVSAFGPRGALSELLAPWGVTFPAVTGFAGAAAVLTLYTYPYVFLTTRASLLSLDGTLIEATRTLNCGRWEAFRRVTLPQILPGVAAGALLVALYTLSDFGTPNIMNVEVYTQFIYARYSGFMRDYAALLSLQLLLVTLAILFVESRIGADDSGAYASRGDRSGATVSLGAWRYPATVFPLAVGLVAVAGPLGTFGLWLTGDATGPGYDAGGLAFSWSYGWNSVYVALLAAVASVAVALPIASRAVTSESRLAALAERAPYVGYATPGIVLAIALASFSLDVATPLYKTLALLVFAYVVRFVSQAIGAVRSSTLQVDARLVEAARTLNAGRLSAFRRVTLPLIAPGVASGAALVFLTTMKELPATLLLRPLRFETLVTYIWRVQEAGLYGRAAVPALVLVVVSGLSMAVILAGENR